MSRALHKLRSAFGDDLLIRQGREYYLSPIAEGLVDPVRDIIRSVEDALESRPAFDPARDSHTFRIAANSLTGIIVLPQLMARLAEQAPGVSLRVRAPVGRKTLEQLESGDLDIGLWQDVADPHLPSQPIFRDRWMMAVWEGSSIAGDPSLTECLQLPRLEYHWDVTERAGFAISDPLFQWPASRSGSATEDPLLRLFLLRGTDLAVPTTERVGRMLAGAAGLRLIDLPPEVPPVTEAMFWHPRNTLNPAHIWLRGVIAEIGASLEAEVPRPIALGA
jgi:DNA-binding transcriptional LysR family regulator